MNRMVKFCSTIFTAVIFFLISAITLHIHAQDCCYPNADNSTCGGGVNICRQIPGSSCADNVPGVPDAGMTWWCTPPGSTADPTYKIPDYRDIPGVNFLFPSYELGTPVVGTVISKFVLYAFAIAGLLLLFYLIYGVFTLLSGYGNPQYVTAGSSIITRALIGFAIIFTSYWITQILELVLGINILGS